jgi:hypothetical protein
VWEISLSMLDQQRYFAYFRPYVYTSRISYSRESDSMWARNCISQLSDVKRPEGSYRMPSFPFVWQTTLSPPQYSAKCVSIRIQNSNISFVWIVQSQKLQNRLGFYSQHGRNSLPLHRHQKKAETLKLLLFLSVTRCRQVNSDWRFQESLYLDH